MEIEELREKLKYVYNTIKKLHEHSIFGCALKPYCSPNTLKVASELFAVYSDKKEQTTQPRIIIKFNDSNAILTIQNKLLLEVTDKVRLETKMSLSEVKEYLEDFFKACDAANSAMAAAILQTQRRVQKEYEMGEDLLKLL